MNFAMILKRKKTMKADKNVNKTGSGRRKEARCLNEVTGGSFV
jgi:hypothetical protein